jgi:capsular polysaccharide biosynthesis protein
VKQQFSIFSSASLIISPHGNPLTNLLYCHKNVTVVEISAVKNGNYEPHIILDGLNMSNYLLLGRNAYQHQTSSEHNEQSDILVPIAEAAEKIRLFLFLFSAVR